MFRQRRYPLMTYTRQPKISAYFLEKLMIASAPWLNCNECFKKIEKNLKKLLTKLFTCSILTKSVAGVTDKWNLSSAGRASALQAEGHRFEPYRFHSNESWLYGEIAQLARACGSYPQCRGFESPSRYGQGLEDIQGLFLCPEPVCDKFCAI